MDEEHQRPLCRRRPELRVSVQEVFLPDQASGAHPPARQERRVVRHQVDGQPMKLPGNDLGQEGGLASSDVDRSRVDPCAERIEEPGPVRADETTPSPVVIAWKDHGRHTGPQSGDDSCVEVEKERHGLFRSVRARIEDVAGNEKRRFSGMGSLFLTTERLDEYVEERALAALRGVDVQVR